MNAPLTESSKERWIESFMAVLMSFATLASAWSSYQYSAWTRRVRLITVILTVPLYGFAVGWPERGERNNEMKPRGET